MWLCTDIGFFSVVRKSPDVYHVRARVRRDLENIKGMMAVDLQAELPEIEHWGGADYAWRIIVSARTWSRIGLCLSYSNFKGRIGSLPDQRAKMGAYHNLWHAGCLWQEEDPARHAKRLASGGVDDLRCSLAHTSNREILVLALAECERGKQKTMATMIRRRIKQLDQKA